MLPARLRRLKAKLLGLSGIGILSVGLIAMLSFYSLSRQIDQYQGIMQQEVAATSLAESINLNFKRQVQEWKNVLLRGQVEKDRLKYWNSFKKLQGVIQADAARFLSFDVDSELLAIMRDFKGRHEALLDQYQQGYNAFAQSNFDATLGDNSVRGIDREPTKLLEGLATKLNDVVSSKSKITSSNADGTIAIGISFILIAIIASSFISLLFMNRNIVRPLVALINHLREVSKGNFADELTFERIDEIGLMSNAIEVLRKNLLDICEEMAVTQKDLDQVCFSLVDSAGAISNGVQEQNTGTENVSESIHELSVSAKDITENANMASEAATLANDSATEGKRVMEDTIASIRSSSAQIKDTASVISRLDEDAKSIGSVLDVIKSIAEQTNLLALNAAIEAARAGEHGRGFAVVADEVRSLAAKTQESTEEIQQMIENVQSGARDAVTAIEQGQQATEASVDKVLTAGSNLDTINRTIQEISQLNSHIAITIKEQTTVTDKIDQSMEGLGEIAKLNRIHADSCAEDNETLSEVRVRMDNVIQKLNGTNKQS